jgi:hypothetical protein
LTIVGLLMFVVFGFLAVRHFRNGRLFWAVATGFGSLLGAASVWVDYQRATADPTVSSATSAPATSQEEQPVIGDYDPNADYTQSDEPAPSEPEQESGE